MSTNNKKILCLLGASFDTGNAGVSALAESTIKSFLHTYPQGEIMFLGSSRRREAIQRVVSGKSLSIEVLPLRFSWKIWLSNHIGILYLCAIIYKLFRFRLIRNMVARNETIRLILSTDFVGDITGGDSFSDIYGVQRFVQNYICKSLVLLLGRPYILLPQTYGPFSRKWSRVLAARIIRKSQKIYSRDREGLTVVKDLLGGKEPSNLKFVPDVAFVMDKTCPARMDIAYLDSIIRRERPVIGFNVSGLLYHGGYTKNNMFGLQVDYRALMTCIIEYLLKNTKAIILFVPHVFAPPGHVESDTYACTQLLEQFQSHYPERLTMARGPYSHTEIKYIIGFSDFFAGSRMHACIGAMSQTIPAAGLAYSRKFEGVFNSVGVDDCVVNLCRLSTDEALQQFCRIYEMRLGVKERLQSIIPEVQKKILNLFAD